MTEYAFGIDLSGYSTGGTACATATLQANDLRVVVLDRSPLNRKRRGSCALEEIETEDCAFLLRLLRLGSLAVDVPIDLQGLSAPENPRFVWELTLRPIDHSLNALRPFGDKIGSTVARFQSLLRDQRLKDQLGTRLFETYPGGSRRLLGRVDRSAIIPNQPNLSVPLTEDEIDAAICAISALERYTLKGNQLIQRLRSTGHRAIVGKGMPEGYILLRDKPCEQITISRRDADEWLRKVEP